MPPPKVKPNDPVHRGFEENVVCWLQQHAYHVAPPSTIYDRWPEELQDLIKRRWSFTALKVRTESDRIVMHRILPVDFLLDIKGGKTGEDLCIEALPYLLACDAAERFGVRRLYAAYHPRYNREYGFWARRDGVRLRELRLTDKLSLEQNTRIWDRCREWWHDLPVRRQPPTACGSDDPFFVIDKSLLIGEGGLPHWQDLVVALADGETGSRKTAPPVPWITPPLIDGQQKSLF